MTDIVAAPDTASLFTVPVPTSHSVPPPEAIAQEIVQELAGRISARLPPGADGDRPEAAPDRDFSELLRAHRVRSGLTQRALADLSTISPRAIRDIEAGRARARAQTIVLLADALRLTGLMRDLFVHAGLGAGRPDPAAAGRALALPKPVNALVGRDTEVRAMVEVLESGRRRMVSVSGLPGVGKTRVAAEVAARLTARRDWPVLWIGAQARCLAGPGRGQLGPLTHAVRRLLEAPDGSGPDDVARICALVGRHELLLVLDGVADGVANGAAPAGVEELLAYCPGLRVISTSRAPWRVAGVQPSVLAPLATPGPGVEALAAVPSVRLLVDRLAEVRPGFVLTAENAAEVARICRRTDGLPLALEAVAERFRVLSLAELAGLPTGDLLGLTVPTRPGGPVETIGALIAAGLAGIGARHRDTLRALVGFDRPWTVAEAAAVLGRPDEETVEEMGVLIGCGLVRSSHGEPASDLHIPNLLRLFLLREQVSGPVSAPDRAAHPAAAATARE